MSAVHKNTLQTLAYKVPILVLTFIHTILLIRLLGQAGNGVYSFLIANAYLGVMLYSVNFKSTVIYFISHANYPLEKIIGLAFWVMMIGGASFVCFIILSFTLSAPWLSLLLPVGYEGLFFIGFLILYTIYLFILSFCEALLLGNLKFKVYNRFSLISNLFLLITLGGTYIIHHTEILTLSLSNILTIVLISQLINVVIFFIVTIKSLSLKIDFEVRNIGLIKPFFEYALKGYFTSVANFFNKRIDVWFVEFFSGISNLGIYALAASLTNFILEAFRPIYQVMMPHLARMDELESGKLLMMYARLTFLLSGIAAITVFLLAGWLIPAIFGQAFIGAVLPVRILLLGVVIISMQNVFGAYASAKNKLHFIVYGKLFGLCTTIVLDISLIPSFGIIGASIASISSYLVSNVYIFMCVLKEIKQPWHQAFLFGKSDWIYWKKQIYSN